MYNMSALPENLALLESLFSISPKKLHRRRDGNEKNLPVQPGERKRESRKKGLTFPELKIDQLQLCCNV